MTRGVTIAGRVTAGVLAATSAGLVTNILTGDGRSLPGWLSWATDGARAWWTLGVLAGLAVVVGVCTEIAGRRPEPSPETPLIGGSVHVGRDAYIAREMSFDQRREERR